MIIASELGTSSAPVTPCSPRATISTVAPGAIAASSEVTPNPISPAANTRLRPNRSDSEPASRMNDPSVTRYASTIHCCAEMPPPRSSRIAGSATFTTDTSRNATNEPRMLATRTSRCARVMGPDHGPETNAAWYTGRRHEPECRREPAARDDHPGVPGGRRGRGGGALDGLRSRAPVERSAQGHRAQAGGPARPVPGRPRRRRSPGRHRDGGLRRPPRLGELPGRRSGEPAAGPGAVA